MIRLFTLAMSTLFYFTALAQSPYTLDITTSKMSILGTSTLHDWESNVEEATGELTLDIDGNQLRSLNSLSLTVTVKSIKSGKSGMDKNTYNALKEKEYPQITYQLSSVENITANDLKVSGELSIAGVTNTKELISQYVIEDQSVVFNGAITFNMSEFDIKPPTALMGTIKTGDEITIEYDVIFTPK